MKNPRQNDVANSASYVIARAGSGCLAYKSPMGRMPSWGDTSVVVYRTGVPPLSVA